MTETSVYAAIDGGGTTTDVVLVDTSGAVRARLQAPTSNPTVIGHEASAGLLTSVLGEALAKVPLARLEAAWFGLSGADRDVDRSRLLPALERLLAVPRLTNDAELVCGSLPSNTGIALIAGTGSIAFGIDLLGRRARSGGWGHIIGDEGSGYGLVRDALRAVARAVDGRGPATALRPMFTTELHVERDQDLITWTYDPGRTKADIAALAHLVFRAAADQDPAASKIIETGANDLADLVHTVGDKLDLPTPLPLAMTGGLLKAHPSYRHAVLERLEQTGTLYAPVVIEDVALAAARSLIPGRLDSDPTD